MRLLQVSAQFAPLGLQSDPASALFFASGGGEPCLLEPKGSGGPEGRQEGATHSDFSQESHPPHGGR